ncbi:MAG: WbqC family protein [Candidatus Omnitrophica bacterium]|nr:WbqC family protein [Candidatus Omnitrophota bacterium]
MICAIHQPQYMPWLGYFDKIDKADVFILLDDVQFKKNEWQNRNKIRTAQGWQWITVPVLHDFGQKINTVHIDNNKKWRHDHLRAIELSYGKAPYYGRYKDFIDELYKTEWFSLAKLNTFIIDKIVGFLGIGTKLVLASDFNIQAESTQRLIDLCRAVGADTYLAGADGHKYMDVELFRSSGIVMQTQQYEHPVYPQLWCKKDGSGFVSHMAIIDVLFNHGDKSLEIIQA